MKYVYGISKSNYDPVVFFATRKSAYKYAKKFGANFVPFRCHWLEALMIHRLWHKWHDSGLL